MIVSTGVPTGLLRSEKQYENFILELEWKHLKAGGNAGLFVWSDPLTALGEPVCAGDGSADPRRPEHGELHQPRRRVRHSRREHEARPAASERLDALPAAASAARSRRASGTITTSLQQRRDQAGGQRQSRFRRDDGTPAQGLPVSRVGRLAGPLPQPADSRAAVHQSAAQRNRRPRSRLQVALYGRRLERLEAGRDGRGAVAGAGLDAQRQERLARAGPSGRNASSATSR